MTLGSIILLGAIIAMFVIGMKVKKNSRKLEELEKTMSN